MRELSGEEVWRRTASAKSILGFQSSSTTTGSSPSMYDLKIIYPDGSIGAVEVTAAAVSGRQRVKGHRDFPVGGHLIAALLPDRERVLGPDHPDTMATRHKLAGYTGLTGDPAGARDQLAALLPDLVRVLGADHTDTQVTRDSLVYWSRQAQAGSG